MKKIRVLLVFVLCLSILSSSTLHVGATTGPTDGPTEDSSKVTEEGDNDVDIITEKTADIQINIGEGQSTPESSYGKEVKIDIPLINQGKEDAHKVKITPILDSSSDVFPYEIKKMNYDKEIGKIEGTTSKPNKADRTHIVSYSFITRSDVTTGYKKLSFLISYETADGIKESATKDLFVKTIGAPPPTEPTEPPMVVEPIPTPEAPISVPRVIVSGFTTEPGEVKAGEQFKLTLHITNTSSKTSVNNLEFNFQSETDGADPATAAAAFLPVAGSNTIFLKSIGKEETKDITIDLTAKADLAQKPYLINLGMKYEDSKTNEYASESSVSIPVKQEARVEVGEPQVMPNSIMVGQEANVMFSIINIGKTKLYNASVKFQSDSISGGESFAGNIEPGATGNIDAMLLGQVPTMDDGIIKVIISYEDESGQESTIEKEISLFVNEPYIEEEFPGFPGEEFPEEESTSSPAPFIFGGVILLIIAVATFIILKRRKMNKEGFEEDEIS